MKEVKTEVDTWWSVENRTELAIEAIDHYFANQERRKLERDDIIKFCSNEQEG